MADPDPNSFENALIDDMRANGGKVTSGPLAGHPLVIVTSKGAKSGEPRRAILTFSRDGDDLVVAGSAGGAPTDPAWIRNVRADPDVQLEADNQRFDATANVVDGEEHDRLWDQHVESLPHFADYPNTAQRTIPVVRLTRRAA